MLNVKNVSGSHYKLKQALIDTKPLSTQVFICPDCESTFTSNAICSQCSNHLSTISKPNSFFYFSIKNQIERILQYNKDISSTHPASAVSMRDIQDGAVYRKLQSEIYDPFITLTLNVDGIQPHKCSTQTIWPILLVINEIPLKRRFALENIILAGVWPSPSKPTRNGMKIFLRPLTDELLTLEQGEIFELHDEDDSSIAACVFLIGACCDKPAQTLLQCLSEPNAAFGCGRCEVEGFIIRY